MSPEFAFITILLGLLVGEADEDGELVGFGELVGAVVPAGSTIDKVRGELPKSTFCAFSPVAPTNDSESIVITADPGAFALKVSIISVPCPDFG